ncbi:MAG: hypothetical protein ACKOAH_10245, partial [Pirellula sp.]
MTFSAFPKLIAALALVASCPWGDLQVWGDDQELKLLAKNQAKSLSIAFQNAANQAMPAVVTVLAKRADVDATLDELDLLDSNSTRNYNIGSGVILEDKGLCVTNHHVIKDT